MFPTNGRSIVATLMFAALALNGCTSWRVQSVPVARLVEAEAPGRIRVDHADGTRLVLHRPMVFGDSIRSTDIAVAVRDVNAVAVRRFNPFKALAWTTGAVVGLSLYCWATACIGFMP